MLLTRSCLQPRSVHMLGLTKLRWTLQLVESAVLMLELQRGHMLTVQLSLSLCVTPDSAAIRLQPHGLFELPV